MHRAGPSRRLSQCRSPAGAPRKIRWYPRSLGLAQQGVQREGLTHSSTNLSTPEEEARPPPECLG